MECSKLRSSNKFNKRHTSVNSMSFIV